MSYINEILEELKKKQNILDSAPVISPYKSSVTSGLSRSTGGSGYMDQVLEELYKITEAQRQQEQQDIAPASHGQMTVGTLSDNGGFANRVYNTQAQVAAQVEQDKEKDLFGLDFVKKVDIDNGWDVGKAVLGTVGDAGLGIAKGILGTFDSIVDAGTYLVADAHELFGNKTAANGLRLAAKTDVMDAVFGDAEDYLDKYSVLGRTSDALAQGIGQVGSTLLLGAAGGAPLATGGMFVSGVGSGMSEAYAGGADDVEARHYGLISGTADAITEMLFGGLGKAVKGLGISKGIGGLDDMLAQKVTSKISNTILKNTAQFGIKAAGEGAEEVLAGLAQAVGKKVTYMSEKELSDIIEDENLLEQFIVGAATSGITQSGIVPGMKQGSLIESNKTGRDFITGFNASEQSVIDKVVADRVEARKAKGETVTKKQESKILEEVQNALKKGQIDTDTIESVLAADEVKAYKDAYASEDALIKEYNDLYNTEEGKLTVGQRERYDKIKDSVKYAEGRILSEAAKKKLDEKVSGFTKDSFLSESYAERERAGQKFTVDLDSVNEKYRQTYKDAMDSGVFTNKRSVHEAIDYFAKLSADKGVKFNFTSENKLLQEAISKLSASDQQTVKAALDGKLMDNLGEDKLQSFIEKFATNKDGSIDTAKVELLNAFAEDAKFARNVNGWYNPKDGSITYKAGSAKGWRSTVGHELTHVLEQSKHYDKFREAIQEYSKKKGDYDTRLKGLEKFYKPEDLDYELTADLGGDYVLTDAEFATHLFQSDRNVFQKVYDEIKHLYKLATAGSQEARLLETAKHNFEKAYREAGKVSAAEGADTKYAFVGKNADGVEVYETSEEVKNLTNKERIDRFQEIMNDEYRGRTAKFEVNGETYYATFDSADISKNIYGDKDSSKSGWKAKIKTGADGNIFELVENAEYTGSSAESGKTTKAHSGITSWDYFVKTVQIDNTAFNVLANVRKSESGEYVYSITLRPNKKTRVSPPIGTENGSVNTGAQHSSDSSIAQNASDVNRNSENSDKKLSLDADNRYSLSDNTEVSEEAYYKADTEYHDISVQMREAKKKADSLNDQAQHDALMNVLGNKGVTTEEMNAAMEVYNKWADESGYNAASREYKALETKQRELYREKQRMEERLSEKLREREYTPEEVSKYVSKAVRKFRTTTRLSNAGYLLTTGSMLDFSQGQGYRVSDHREISEVLDLPDYAGYSDGMTIFMNMGNIRLQSYGIDISAMPTSKQITSLRSIIQQVMNEYDEFSVDFSKKNGNNAGSVTYPRGTATARIINDIKGYFENGTMPEPPSSLGQFRYSLSDTSNKPTRDVYGFEIEEGAKVNEDLLEELQIYHPEAEVDSRGNVTVYHRTSKENADSIYRTGIMTAKEDALFFSSKEEGYASDYGDTVVALKIPSTELRVNDIFDGEVHFDIPLQYRNGQFSKNVSKYLSLRNSFSVNSAPALYGDDVRGTDLLYDDGRGLEFAEDVAPVKETVSDAQAISEMFPDDYAPMSEEEAAARDSERIDSLTDADAPRDPAELEAPYDPSYGELEGDARLHVDPFAERDFSIVGNRKVKAYMYENPEVKPFFQDEAYFMLGELDRSTKGEKFYDDKLYYESRGEAGWSGTSRQTSEDIAYLLDECHYTYDQIRAGLNAIIEDNGAENNAVSKKIEFLLHDRLSKGYTDFSYGDEIPPNQNYIDLLNNKAIIEYNDEARKKFFEVAQQYMPQAEDDIAPVAVAAEKVAKDNYEAIRPERPKYGDKLARREVPVEPKETTEDIVNRYFEKGTLGDDTAATHVKDAPTKAKNRSISHLRRLFLDKGSVFEDLSLKTKNRELQGKWQRMLTSEQRAQTFIGEGQDGVKSIKSLKGEISKSGKEALFDDYMYHMLNQDRMTLASRFEGMDNKPVFGDGITAEVSRGIANRLAAENPEFTKWAQDVYAVNRQLTDMAVERGLLSSETADLWAKMYPHYVPIHRVGKNGNAVNVPLDTGRTGVNTPFKRAEGGNSNIDYLLDTMATRAEQVHRAIDRNSFGLELKRTLKPLATSQQVTADGAFESVDAEEGLLKKGKDGAKPTFTVFENGKKVTYEITEDMYDAMKSGSDIFRELSESRAAKVLRGASSIHRGLLTEYNPVFMITNAVKDVQDVLMNSQHAFKTYKSIPKAMAEMATRGRYYQEYMENGGDQNTYFDRDTKTFTEDSRLKKILGIPFEAISKANNVIELTPRLAEYIASRESGRSVDVSMLDAARVTTNFLAGGEATKFLNRNGATFLNASVQGAMQQVRNIREAKANGLKGWVSLAARTAAAGLPALLLNRLLWEDDEEYEELSDYVKQNYYVVAKTQDGTFIRIPKGRTLAVIQSAFEQVSNALTGDDEVDLKSFLELAVNNLAPNNPLEDNVFAPFIQAATNKTWYGEDLVPTRLQDLPKAEQYDESTDALSKWLGETFNDSPYKINYVLDQISGGIGDTFLPMLTPEAERGDDSFLGNMIAPLKDKFTTNATMNNQNVADFYDAIDELTTNAKASTATDDDILSYRFMNSVNTDLSKLYQEKRAIQSSSLSDSEKYAKVQEIQQQIVDITREALGTYGNIEYDNFLGDDYAKIGNKYFVRDEDGWQKLSEDQVSKYKATSAAGDAPYATDGTNHYRWYEPEESEDGEAKEPYWKKISDDELEKQQKVTNGLGISPAQYWSKKAEYDFAYEKPAKYQVARAAGGYDAYKTYSSALYDIKADKDEDGKSISGSRKEKVLDWLNTLDADYGEKLVLFKSEYPADDTYNNEIIEYLNGRSDISFEEEIAILRELGFTVTDDGNVTWD